VRLNLLNFEKKIQNTILKINSLNIDNKVFVFREKNSLNFEKKV